MHRLNCPVPFAVKYDMGQCALFEAKDSSEYLPTTDTPKTVQVAVGPTVFTIELIHQQLTVGWLMSEVIRRTPPAYTVTGLQTQRKLEILDCLLLQYDRKLTVLPHNEKLSVVWAASVPPQVDSRHFTPVKLIGKGACSEQPV